MKNLIVKRTAFGIFLIIFSEITMLSRLKPFVYWFTPLVWLGYIFMVDGFVYSLRKTSLLENKKKSLTLFMISALVWWGFECINEFGTFKGWKYINLPPNKIVILLMGTLAFSTIMPAVFETKDLLSLLLSRFKIGVKPKISRSLFNNCFLFFLTFLGLIFITLPFTVITPWVWTFVWIGFILLLDPLLYLNKDKRSILSLIERKRWIRLISLFLAGYVCGFLVEIQLSRTRSWDT